MVLVVNVRSGECVGGRRWHNGRWYEEDISRYRRGRYSNQDCYISRYEQRDRGYSRGQYDDRYRGRGQYDECDRGYTRGQYEDRNRDYNRSRDEDDYQYDDGRDER